MRVVFLCKGSRGDVGPVLSLLLGYKQKVPSDTCVLATHSSHKTKFQAVLDKYGIEFVALDDITQKNDSNFTAPIQKIELQVSSGKGFSDNERLDRVAEMHCSLRACKGANGIVFNLFACEGWFIAQHLNVPCVAVSPFAVTRTPPVKFQNKFVDAYPELYNRLMKSPAGRVSYGDIDHWMWRLYLNDFGEFCDSLGIPVCPYSELSHDAPLPKPTPLLYGISPTVLEKPGYWPKSVIVCGYWYTDLAYPSLSDVTVLYPSHKSADRVLFKDFISSLDEQQQRPLYIGFGSMDELGFFSSLDCVEIIGVINEALLECDVKALLHVDPESAMFKAWEIMHKNVVNCNIYCITQQVSHAQLFPHCLAIMHHGGSGTVAAAIRASVPQIICPFMFDQSYWGEKVAWIGVGESLGHLRDITVESLTNALKNVTQSECLNSVTKYNELLGTENGVSKAANIIKNVLYKSNRLSSSSFSEVLSTCL